MGKCSDCKYYVDTSCHTDCGIEYDGFCLIKGNDFDCGCNWVFPFKQIVGGLRKKKYEYYLNHEYDGFVEHCEQSERETQRLTELIQEHIFMNSDIYFKNNNGDYHKFNQDYMIEDVSRVRYDYEDFAHPIEIKTLRAEWKELIKKTVEKVTNKIKPYLFT